MSRTIAPLLSFGASGQIAKTQVYASWKGRQYARRYVIPTNPRSLEQTSTRDVFRWLNDAFRYFPSPAVAAWQLKARNNQITDRNQFIKDNLGFLRDEVDLTNLTISPAAGGGLAAGAMLVTPGNDQLQIDLTAPPLPTGWTITQAHFAAIRDQDPHSGTFFTVAYGFDATSAYTTTLVSLASAALYQVAAWFEYVNANGDTVYGINSRATGLTT